MDKRLKKMTAIFFLAAAADLFLAAVLLASLARQRAEGAAAPGAGRVVEDGGWSGGCFCGLVCRTVPAIKNLPNFLRET